MDQNKLNRLNEDCHRALTEILRRVKDPRVPDMLTIVKVSVTRDLSYCDVYVSALEGSERTKEAVKGLKSAGGYIRRELSSTLHTYKVPELRFIADDSIEHSAHIWQLLENLRPEERSED